MKTIFRKFKYRVLIVLGLSLVAGCLLAVLLAKYFGPRPLTPAGLVDWVIYAGPLLAIGVLLLVAQTVLHNGKGSSGNGSDGDLSSRTSSDEAGVNSALFNNLAGPYRQDD